MRYKEFNSKRVLEKSINLFWNKGFGGCSVKEIVNETAVNRFSLYNEFENKEGILYASLLLYKERYSAKKLAKDYGNNSLLKELTALFSSFLLEENTLPPGCFIIHIATELADSDKHVKKVLNEYTLELENAFLHILNRFQPANSENLFYAKHLVGLFCSSVCHCVIQSETERVSQISTSLNVLLNKKSEYAAHA